MMDAGLGTPSHHGVRGTDRYFPEWLASVCQVVELTPRELELFLLLVDGEPNQVMAERLDVSERTIRAHLTNIGEKLDLHNRVMLSLCSYAYQFGSPRSGPGIVPPFGGREQPDAGVDDLRRPKHLTR